MSLLAESNHREQEEQYESCVKYSVSSHTTKKREERTLYLTIHFQKAQFPPTKMGRRPLFDYQLRQVHLSIILYNTRMLLDHVNPTLLFSLYSEHTIKKLSTGETSNSATGKIDSKIIPEFSASFGDKKTQSFGEEFTQKYSNIDIKHISDYEIYWNFKSHDSDQILKGMLKDHLLGKLTNHKEKAKAKISIRVFEKDIVATPPVNLTKLGLRGFVTFKYQRTSIANDINARCQQEIFL